jgi:hypothetical protein
MAEWQSTGTYGDEYTIRGARNMSLSLVVESDELRGDDVVLDAFSKIVAAEISIEFATVDLALFDMIMGGTLIQTADYYSWDFGGDDDPPYVGIAGRVVGSGGDGDLHIFIKKARLSSNLALAAQVDTYMLPSATFRGVDDDGSMFQLMNFTAATALEIPLRTTTGGF